MSDIFISYARSTETQAKQVADALTGLGYGVWRDDEIPANRAYADVIAERLANAQAVVVIWSAEAAKSEWVRSEAERARADHKLVQLSVDGARLPMPFDQTQCANLAGWSGGDDTPGWKQVVRAIANLASPSQARHEESRKVVRKLSICVLPFANMSDDPQQEYFSDGISEDIITDLSKVSALSVVARNTAFGFKGKSPNVKEVAHQLGVSHVLEGSVRKAGGRVRITAQLIDGAAGDHVWAERYDRDLTDIFALQDEISEAIVKALKLKLLPEEKQAIEQRGTDNVEAYNLYLMARQDYITGNSGDARRDESIVRLCARATQIDPAYARAWTLMASAQANLRFLIGKQGDGGLEAADRALALEANRAEAHAVKGRILLEDGHMAEAEAEIAMARRLEPDSYEVNQAAATLSFRQRRLEDACRYWEKAAALMETDFGAPGMMVTCYTALGDISAARRVAQMTVARAETALVQDRNNGRAMAHAVTGLTALGEVERAREWIDRALLVDPDNMTMRYNFACALTINSQDIDAALALLGPVVKQASAGFLNHAKVDPDLDPLRGDPRFQTMIAAAEARLGAAKAG